MTFSEWLSQAMAERGMTNYRLAKELGVSETSIANWKNGKKPRSRSIVMVSQYFGGPEYFQDAIADQATTEEENDDYAESPDLEGSKAYVYALQHGPTGKVYVGCTKDVERRVRQHITQLIWHRHPIKQMQADYDKYGGNYYYYVLFSAFAGYDAFQMERHFMSLLGTRDPQKGYNSKDNSREFSLKNFHRKNALDALRKAPEKEE